MIHFLFSIFLAKFNSIIHPRCSESSSIITILYATRSPAEHAGAYRLLSQLRSRHNLLNYPVSLIMARACDDGSVVLEALIDEDDRDAPPLPLPRPRPHSGVEMEHVLDSWPLGLQRLQASNM